MAAIYFRVRVAAQANIPWVYSLINGLFIGGAVGSIYGIGTNHRIAIYFIVGLLAGAVTSLFVQVAPIIADVTAFLLWGFSSSLDISMWYRKLAVFPIEGIIQSLFIWITVVQAEKISRTIR